MFCPRCGTENEPDDRFCSSCGASLRSSTTPAKDRRSLRDRLSALAGTSRRDRIVTGATVAAVLVAIAAFIALDPAEDDDEIPRDAYTVEADAQCVDFKRRIVAAERDALDDQGSTGSGGFAGALVPVVADWRSEFQTLAVPEDRTEEVARLETALRQVEIELAGLALAAADGNRDETVAQAKEVDSATVEVEESIAGLGHTQCATRTIGLRQPPQG